VTLPGYVDHLIVGSGFAGLCAAIKLAEIGETDYVVIERGHEVGGTWRDNTYPGACCDIPSQLYSFSFARNPGWTSSYSPQPEIQEYLRRLAREFGVLDRTVFETELEQATWDDDAQVWRCRTTSGEVVAKTLVSGAGGLSEPRLPEVAGIESFAGPLFHSARWDHSVDLRGKRVAVIGTGASAIQIVPEVTQVASHLDVYQRTAPWVIPRNDRRYPRLERLALRRLPGLARLYRTGISWALEG
jgi:cation diffusion facilitator CzcD-associated flavoprotein CzcO